MLDVLLLSIFLFNIAKLISFSVLYNLLLNLFQYYIVDVSSGSPIQAFPVGL